MKSYSIFRTCFFAAFALSVQVPGLRAQGNLVSNGDFGAGSQGWTLLRGAFAENIGSDHGFVVLLASTNEGPAGEPTASQSLTGLLPGATYLVSGDYEPQKDRGGASPTNASLGLAFDGTYVFELAAAPNGPWQHFSFNYTATSSSEVLSLTSQINGTGLEYMIDNISMVAIPEPGSVLLPGTAVCLLIARMTRARRRPR